jgi:alkylhydroperoxidase family enzyme
VGQTLLFPRVPASSTDPEVRKAYVNAFDLFGPISDLFSVLANAPTLLDGWVDMVRNLRQGLAVEDRLSEIAIVRVAQIGGAHFVAAAHSRLAVKAGVAQAKVDTVSDWRGSQDFDSDERLVLEFAEQLAAGTAEESVVLELQDRLGVRETAELIIATSFYCCVARVVTTMGITSLSASH